MTSAITTDNQRKRFAVRTIRLCTKDCLCLYVCPTGATDTEDSVIDRTKCIGCGACADACPSGAISLVPIDFPPQQPHEEPVVRAMNAVSASKAAQERAASALSAVHLQDAPGLARLMAAFARSNRLMAEDILRESGYMLPQSAQTKDVLERLVAAPPSEDFPVAAAKGLLDSLRWSDE